jgi:hypothetical protein
LRGCHSGRYRAAMATKEPTESQPLGFNIDIGEILKEVTKPKRRTRRSSTSRASGAGDMDAAIRRAIRVELADVERALKQLAEEVVRLRRANEDLAEKVARALRS